MFRVCTIIVLGFLAYGCMLPSPFRVMDDRISIIENPLIKSDDVAALFKEGYFHDQSYYRPLVNLSYMAEYRLFGLNSFFYNLDNLLIHIANALLVMFLVSRLTGNASIGFWAGLLFVVHPVQWEAVCNVPGRSILLSAMFELASFLLFLKFYENRRWFMVPLNMAFFFLALLCKESAAMLPVVILAYLALDKSKSWPEKFGFFWAFPAVIAAYIFLRSSLGITQMHQASSPLVYILGFVTFLRSVITDLRLFVLPVDLHYDRCLTFMLSLAQPQAWGTCLFWAFFAAVIVLNRQKIPGFVLFLIGWFWIELFPVSQLVVSVGVGAGHVSSAEHFLYLACIPVFIGMVMAFRWAYDSQRPWVSPFFLRLFAGGVVLFFWLVAVEQSLYASNEYSMLSRSLQYEPDNPRVQGAMAMLSVFRNDIPDAQKHFEAAINAEPLNPSYHIGLGTAFGQQGQWVKAMEQFVALDPGKNKDLVEKQEKLTIAHINDQLAAGRDFDSKGWLAVGIYYARHGQNKEAIDAFVKSVRGDEGQGDAWFNLGSLYEGQHDWAASRAAYEKLLQIKGISDFQKNYASEHLMELGNK